MLPVRIATLVLNGLACTALPGQYLAEADLRSDIERMHQAGTRAAKAGKCPEAIEAFDRVILADPGHVNARLERGACHTRTGNYEKAIEDFTAVIGLKPDHQWAYTCRADAHYRSGDHRSALQDIDRAIAMDPRNAEAYNNRGWVRKALGDLAGACEDWRTSQRLGNAEARIIRETNRCR